ncbi:MAG TPA: hypothetical protein VH496_14260 [Mycobacterium sp.]|jgi:hypothetical protein
MTASEIEVRPEITALSAEQRARVYAQLDRRHATCACCGHRDFSVGDALYLGFLFVNEEPGTYMVALTCTNDDCRDPRTGIRLQRSEFFDE